MKTLRNLMLALMAFIAVSVSAQSDKFSRSDLEAAIKELNSECPTDLGDGMSISGVKLTQKELVMEFLVKEDNETVEMMGMMSDQLGPILVQNLKQDEDSKMLVESCKALGLDFIFSFSNPRGAQAQIRIPNSKL